MSLRCAVYCRFSTNRQHVSSIEDQLRKCRDFAARQGWQILDEHIYSDQAVSGASMERIGLQQLLATATAPTRKFDCILIDDTSRLTRKLADALNLFEQLSFAGIRLVAVSQGVDSLSPQAELLFGVHGLIDSAYWRELGQKTHRGLEGLALRGLHTGGRIYGYSIVDCAEGKRLVVNEPEALIVRRIFQMSAENCSLRNIAMTLNREGISPPRPRKSKTPAGWCPTAIREMLYSPRYAGKIVWNRTRFLKVPGTNRRVARPRPREEWRTVQLENLRIISDELLGKVHARLLWVKQTYSYGRPKGLLSRSASSRYLFSGLLVCSKCGGRIRIICGHGKRSHPRYGCPRSYYRGTCPNNFRERHDRLESRLLRGLQEAVLQPEAVNYALVQFEKELGRQLKTVAAGADALRHRKLELELELRRLSAAIAEGGHSAFLLDAIAKRESELRNLTERILIGQQGSKQAGMADMRQFVLTRLADIRGLLYADVGRARHELAQHIKEIVLRPTEKEGKRYYVASGEWDLLGKSSEVQISTSTWVSPGPKRGGRNWIG